MAAEAPSPRVMMSSGAQSGKKLLLGQRILMLHGYTQNGSIFYERSRSFERKFRGAGAILHFVDGPVDAAAFDGRENPRAWWTYDPLPAGSDPLDPARFSRVYKGWETVTRPFLEDLWKSSGPFDGICGFSQGAVVAHQLFREIEAAQQRAVDEEIPLHSDGGEASPIAAILAQPPKFAILVCGFPAAHGGEAGLPPGCVLETQAAVVVQQNDEVVPEALQRELAACFRTRLIVECEKGHAMPQKSEDLTQIIAFVSQCVKGKAGGDAKAGAPQSTQ